MKKILKAIEPVINFIKKWIIKNKKILKKISIILGIVVGVVLISILSLYIYLNKKYLSNIQLEGAFVDITAMDFDFSKRDIDDSYDEEKATKITFTDNENVAIKSTGTYILSGTLKNAMVIVEGGEQDKIHVVLDNCIIENNNGPAFYIKSSDKVFITLAKDSVNKISDGAEYEYIDEETNVDGAIFSKADLTINGSGSLEVTGNYKHGVVSKDDLVICGGTYDITSVKKGLNGKDCVKIYDGDIKINAGTDGICSDNAEDSVRGYVYIENGNIDITSGNDGIQAENVLKLQTPMVTVCAGGGSINAPVRENSRFNRGDDDEAEEEENTESIKGLKAGTDILISEGQYIIDTVDDTVHANGSIKIEGGKLDLKSGDDGIHADNTLQIVDGDIDIANSYEGLEGYQISMEGGTILVVSTDDGINASAGSDSVGIVESIKRLLVRGLNGKLEILGGELTVNAEGDGLDSNGVMTISGGTTIVAGPVSGGNNIIDCDGKRVVNGGIVLCIGMEDEDNEFSDVNNQSSITTAFAEQDAGTLVEICDDDGKAIVSFEAPKAYDSILATAPEIIKGNTYVVKVDGETIGTIEN